VIVPKEADSGFECDWGAGTAATRGVPPSRVFRFEDFKWEGVTPQPYKLSDDWREIVRHEIAGRRGEQTAFHLRYFEVGPGGYSTFEQHRHEHVVVVIRGRGRVRLGEVWHDVEPLDAVYVAPETPHQFVNPYGEPFGFLCIVDAERDRPRRIQETDSNSDSEMKKGHR